MRRCGPLIVVVRDRWWGYTNGNLSGYGRGKLWSGRGGTSNLRGAFLSEGHVGLIRDKGGETNGLVAGPHST